MRVLIGGVGYRNLRDHSFGVLATDALAAREWPDHVSVEDVSYNPIAFVQRLEDDPRERRFGLAILIGAVTRPGREPGTLVVYRWDNALPDAERIQGSVSEAVTGVIALDNTLIVGRQFAALPRDVVVIEAEPAWQEFGDELSPAVARVLDRACDVAARLALDPAMIARVPESALGGGSVPSGALLSSVTHAGVRL
jgi:hydrogenase maturation protease